MSSLFSKIIDGELPGHFVWKDDVCVAFLSIGPIKPGHTLVVPRAEVDHWLDLEPEVVAHLSKVSQSIGRALFRVHEPLKVATLIAGLEVPHVHVHVFPIWELADVDFKNAATDVSSEDLAREAEKLKNELRHLGYSETAD